MFNLDLTPAVTATSNLAKAINNLADVVADAANTISEARK